MREVYPAAELEKWVRRCRKGDAAAWDRIVEAFSTQVYGIARRNGLSLDDADDVFQTTFLQLYKNLDRIENPATLPKWIAVTASRESYRVSRLRRSSVATLVPSETLESVLSDEDTFIDEQVALADESERLRRGVSELQEKCRDLLTLLYLADDPSYDRISSELGIAIGSIGPTRARCLDKLRSILAKFGFFESTYQR